MQTSQPSVFARDHTIIGVCEALGEDFGFNPLFLRIAFSLGLFFSHWGALAVYAGLGLLVVFTRFAVPNPSPKTAEADSGSIAEAQAEPEMALAA
ncbi:MAG: PspC domain-containing protein [Allosphingosinicella sp.]